MAHHPAIRLVDKHRIMAKMGREQRIKERVGHRELAYRKLPFKGFG
jgi:hypothetical protein